MKDLITICFVAVVLFLCACPALGVVEFKDGLTHNINYQINDWEVYVDYQTPSMYTTVNWLDGAINETGYLNGYENSRINVCGGYVFLFSSCNSSQVNISSGTIGKWLWSSDSSHVNISGGLVAALQSHAFSQVNISGGEIPIGIQSSDSSQVKISGGKIASTLDLSDNSTITICGSYFAVDGQPVGYGELTGSGYLTGTLRSGELINDNFYIYQDARIILIPEPATLLLLGLGGLMLRKRMA